MQEFIVMSRNQGHAGRVVVPEIRHSETLAIGQLVAVSTTRRHIPPGNTSPELRPGLAWHYRNQQPYCVNALVFWLPTKEVGVWHNPLYFNPSDPNWSPHWFRPLETTDGAGWLDPVDGHYRFLRSAPEAPC